MSIYIDEFEKVYGISGNLQSLRDKVLNLAVQGKLVNQQKGVETSEELYIKILNTKEQWISVGKDKKSKEAKKPSANALRFDIPNTWSVIRLDDIAKFIDYRGKTPTKTESGVRLITAKNIKYGYIDENPREYIAEKDFASWMTRGIPDTGNVVFTTEAPLANVARLYIKDKYALAQRAITFNTYVSAVDGFLLRALMSPLLREIIFELATGTTVLGIKASKLKELIIPLPPLDEQRKIENRVDELFLKIDKLEEQLKKKEHLLKQLPQAIVDSIGACRTGEELKEQLEFVIQNFETIFQTPESMQELRNVILQLAIEGKLVPQDPTDEPATELLKRIKAERDQLVKEKKIKKPALLEPIGEDEIPFEIPESWEWVRLEDLCELITKGSSPKWQGINYTEKEEVLFVTSENVGNNELLLSKKKFVEARFNDLQPRSILKENDILMNIVGASIGRTAIYNISDVANINQAVCMIRLIRNYMNLQFMLNFFNSNTCINYMFDKQVDNARANLSMGNISKFVIPIPPFNEQERIVETINSLMSIIDQMEEKLKKKVEIVEKLGTA